MDCLSAQLEHSPKMGRRLHHLHLHLHLARLFVDDFTRCHADGGGVWDYEYGDHCHDDLDFCFGVRYVPFFTFCQVDGGVGAVPKYGERKGEIAAYRLSVAMRGASVGAWMLTAFLLWIEQL